MKIEIDGKPIWVNYHHLYCFYIIVGRGNLTRASEFLNIGQSALSIQMKQFEENLGFPLFVREHRKISPNERGKIMFSYAKEIFRLGGEMIEAVHDRKSEARTHLNVGALDSIPKHLTVRLVEEVVLAKNCLVTVSEGKPAELIADLTDHKIDIVVSNALPITEPGKVYTKKLASLPLIVVGGPRFVSLKKNFPASLHKQPFVIPTGDSRVRHEFENFAKSSEFQVEVIAETQDMMVQKLLALREVGLTVMPEFAVKDYLEDKSLHRIGALDDVNEELFLITASRKIQNPGAAWLMKNFRI